jgi:tRNA nucleotidyltransferase/poly(A) polymerase
MPNITINNIWNFDFIHHLEKNGANVYAVGGCVRDYLNPDCHTSNDVDLMVCNLDLESIEHILEPLGQFDFVGSSFGVIKFKPAVCTDVIDIALPRTEKSTGPDHSDFEISSGPHISLEQDLYRRDFTINAMAMDSDFNIVDPYGGYTDLQKGLIRHISYHSFVEDPLRILRALQFAARFNFSIEKETRVNMHNHNYRIKNVTRERVRMELEKAFSKTQTGEGLEYFAYLLCTTHLYEYCFGNAFHTYLLYFRDVKRLEEFYFLLFNGLNLYANKNYFTLPSELYKVLLNGDNDMYNKIKGLEEIFYTSKTNPVHIVSEALKFNPEIGLNNLISDKYLSNSDKFKYAYFQFVCNYWPKSVKDLAIDGNDLIQLGYSGKEIGQTLQDLLIRVYNNEIKNDRGELLKTLKTLV